MRVSRNMNPKPQAGIWGRSPHKIRRGKDFMQTHELSTPRLAKQIICDYKVSSYSRNDDLYNGRYEIWEEKSFARGIFA